MRHDLVKTGAILAVIGAILRWAVSASVEGFSFSVAGLILLIVGLGIAIYGLVE